MKTSSKTSQSSSTRISKSGMDALLAQHGTSLKPGESVRFRLVKGPSGIVSVDPVAAAAASSSSSSRASKQKSSQAAAVAASSMPTEVFPLVAKFSESVVRPNFGKSPWNHARLYQQDAPKAQDDSDEEQDSVVEPKKRWRRAPKAPKREWLLQTNTEFLETMMAKRQAKKSSGGKNKAATAAASSSGAASSTTTTTTTSQGQVSSRYQGLPEHNASHYAIFGSGNNSSNSNDHDGSNSAPILQVSTLTTPHATINFSQPMARNAMSLTQAEQVISDQRAHMSRYMMHNVAADKDSPNSALSSPDAATAATAGSSKGRLLGKLQMQKLASGGDELDDDVMADVAFKHKRGAKSAARKELLTDMADDGIKVDDDGVMGGTNDVEFGGRRHFGQLQKDRQSSPSSGSAEKGGTAAAAVASNDGLAMADDFYQRDVIAEYEDLDYDANEQFEDDDVDMGEKEEHLDPNSGFAEPDTDEDDEVYDDTEGGAEGLASLAGFRKLLAKARGEAADEQSQEGATDDGNGKTDGSSSSRPSSPTAAPAASKKEVTVNDPLASIFAGAEKTAKAANEPPVKKQKKDTGVLLDKQGRRVLTQTGIQKEIWLNHGSIEAKRLMKTFGVKAKGDKDRYDEFMAIIRTICSFEKDEMGKPIFRLKQHYKKMG